METTNGIFDQLIAYKCTVEQSGLIDPQSAFRFMQDESVCQPKYQPSAISTLRGYSEPCVQDNLYRWLYFLLLRFRAMMSQWTAIFQRMSCVPL